MFECLFGHTWSQWETIERYQIYRRRTLFSDVSDDGFLVGLGEHQRRECLVCGKAKYRSEECRK